MPASGRFIPSPARPCGDCGKIMSGVDKRRLFCDACRLERGRRMHRRWWSENKKFYSTNERRLKDGTT